MAMQQATSLNDKRDLLLKFDGKKVFVTFFLAIAGVLLLVIAGSFLSNSLEHGVAKIIPHRGWGASVAGAVLLVALVYLFIRNNAKNVREKHSGIEAQDAAERQLTREVKTAKNPLVPPRQIRKEDR